MIRHLFGMRDNRGRFRIVTAVATAWLLLTGSMPATAQQVTPKRVALVIGNSEYTNLPKLKNPVNDVREVVNTLRAAQFDVISGKDLSRIQFEELLKTFLRSVEGADVSLIYYSGHGFQIAGKNYLVPVDAKLATPYDVEIESVNVDNIYGYLRENSRMQLLFLDACRDNPFRNDQYWIADRVEKAGKAVGLALPSTALSNSRKNDGKGSLFAFATEPDRVAFDGNGDLSHYTQAFVRRALIPNIEVRQMLTQVRRDVISSTNGQQVPWENSSLTDDFFMIRLPSAPITTAIHRASAVAGGTASQLEIPPPQSPSGAPLTITFDRTPEKGRLLLAGQPIQIGKPLQVADLGRLQYDPRGVPAGHVELLTYSVSDSWKQASPGAVAITVSDADTVSRSATTRPTPAATAPAQPKPVQTADRPTAAPVTRPSPQTPRFGEAHAYLAALQNKTFDVPMGVGPQPLGFPAGQGSRDADAASVTITEVPAAGAVFAGSKRIESGSAVTLAELRGLSFEPQLGTEGRPGTLRFFADTGDRRTQGAVTLRPTVQACDAEAGEPFDLQGVAQGKLPSEINPAVALKACAQAMERYPAVARFQFQLGRAQLAARMVTDAWTSVEASAERGHVRALYQLGYLHRLGVGRPASQTTAVDFFRRGSEKGDPYGIYDYGKALYYGLGVEKNTATGLRMMLQAADMGHTYAMNELGYIFLEGDSIQKDTERGMRFYQAGVDRRDIYSYNNVGLANLRGNGVPRNPKAAFDFFRKASDGGHPYAPTNLGRLYRDGVGVAKNEQLAVGLFERGAERGDYWGALERAILALQSTNAKLRTNIDAGYYLALATALNRPGVGDKDNRARQLLERLPEADKQRVEQRLVQQLGADAASVASSGAAEDRLAALARKGWEKRNPRIDLF